MAINEIILSILSFFILLGALDYSIGNRFGLGKAFLDGIMSMGQITLAMVGIISLAPLLATVLIPIITPVYVAIGADPASFANTILALDMGGYALAQEMGLNADASLFSWVFLGTMLGPTIVFTIPIALRMVEQQHTGAFAKGMLIGISTIPLGCFVGGIAAGFDASMILRNLLIPSLFSVIVICFLAFKPELSVKLFLLFGKSIQIIGAFGLALAAVHHLTDFTLLVGMAPFEEGLAIVGTIAVVLAGAFPFVAFLTKTVHPLFDKLGKISRLDGKAIAAIVSSLAHAIPAFVLMKEMSRRSQVVTMAFIVSGAFVLGGHFGFVASINQEMVVPMMIGKLTGGISAVLIAAFVEKAEYPQAPTLEDKERDAP